jgi:hypothetical protein
VHEQAATTLNLTRGNEVVEALRRHSNRADLVTIMVDVLRRIDEGDKTNEPGVESTGRCAVREPRTEDDVRGLLAGFRLGAKIRELAVRHGMSESTVKRVLARHGASRRNRSV